MAEWVQSQRREIELLGEEFTGAAANPAIALWLQFTRTAGRVAEPGSLAASHVMPPTEKRPIDRLCEKIEAGGLEALTPSERWMFSLTWLCIETNGGGLHQFFFNDAGKFATDAVIGLDTTGGSFRTRTTNKQHQ